MASGHSSVQVSGALAAVQVHRVPLEIGDAQLLVEPHQLVGEDLPGLGYDAHGIALLGLPDGEGPGLLAVLLGHGVPVLL